MKSKKGVPTIYPEHKPADAAVHEAAVDYELRRDVLGVREVKDQLSSLIQRAANGEEIVITSDGEPTAMLVRYRPILRGKPFRPHLALLRSMPTTSDSTALIRKMRDEGY